MKENFEAALKALLKHEGGFVNHPQDPGGMTNLGVTKRVWQDYVKREVDESEMRSLTPEAVAPLYRGMYWDAVRADSLPAGVDLVTFDCAVNAGPRQAAKFLQRAAGVKDDGAIGPATLETVRGRDAKEMIESFSEQRLNFLKALPTFSTFGKGWTRRVEEVKIEALSCLPPSS